MARSTPRLSNGAVTPSDTAYLTEPSQLWVGTLGDVNVLLAEDAQTDTPGNGTIFKNVQGAFPFDVVKVFSTSTTASDIVAVK